MAKRLNNGATQDYLQLAKEALDAAYSARPFGELKDIAYGKVFGVANITCNEIIFQVMYLQGTDEGSYFAKISNLSAPQESFRNHRVWETIFRKTT